MSTSIPERIGGFYIESLLGKGGMALVYKAHPPDGGPPVALKVLPKKYGWGAEYVKRFKREIEAYRIVSSPYLVEIFQEGEDDDYYFFSMELLEGPSLGGLIREKGPLPEEMTVRIGHQLSCALEDLHAREVIHRDIKPANIMMVGEDAIKLMDLGLAKIVEWTSLTYSGDAIGSPRYMAPEVVLGEDVDFRVDIYQVGLVLYECLAGRPAFESESFEHLLAMIVERYPEDLSRLRDDVSRDLLNLVRACIQKDREKRVRSAGELRLLLEAMMEGEPVDMPSVPIKSMSSRAIRRGAAGGTGGRGLSPSGGLIVVEEDDDGEFELPPWFPKVLAATVAGFVLAALLLYLLLARGGGPGVSEVTVGVRRGRVVVRWKTARPVPTRLYYETSGGTRRIYVNPSEGECLEHTIELDRVEGGRVSPEGDERWYDVPSVSSAADAGLSGPSR